MLGALARFATNISANVATLFALSLPVLIGVAAFAVDEASLFLERRQLQATADLAAIYAAGAPDAARERVNQTLADAGYTLADEAVVVETGHYAPDPERDASARFAPGGHPINAVRVGLRDTGRLHFAAALGFAPPAIGVSATASATPLAAYSIGSRLASLNDGVLNAVLGGLLGTEVSLSLADYRALVDVEVSLLEFFDALAGQIDLRAGTYGELLDTKIALADIGVALASAAGGNAVLLELAGLSDDSVHVEMLELIAADDIAHLAIGTSAAIDAQLSALQLLSAAALVADGDRQIQLALGADVPGLVEIGVSLVVGEPPQGGWFALAGPGSFVRTAQVRLKLDISLLGNGGGLGLLSVKLPVYAEIAPAQAELASLTCPPGDVRAARARIAAQPGVLRLVVGDIGQAHFLDTHRPLTSSAVPVLDILGAWRESLPMPMWR